MQEQERGRAGPSGLSLSASAAAGFFVPYAYDAVAVNREYVEAVPKRDERYGRAEIAACRWLVSEWQEAACEEGQFVLRSVRLALEPWEATPGKARA